LLTAAELQADPGGLAKDALTDLQSLNGAGCFGVLKEKDVVGIVVLGGKTSGEPFNQRDLRILQDLKLRLENFLLQALVTTQESLNMVKDSHDMKNDLNALSGRLQWRRLKLKKDEDLLNSKMKHMIEQLDGTTPLQPEILLEEIRKVQGDIQKVVEDQKSSIPTESESLDRLRAKLQNWSEYGRLVSGGFKDARQFERVDLMKASHFAMERWKPAAERQGVKLLLEMAEGDLSVWGEKSLVEQIIENLVDNGLKATQKGHVKIRCSRKNDQALIQVEDTGCGIPKDQLGTILTKPFYQGKNRESLEKSTGIGLYLVAQYAKSMNGEAVVDSVEDQGSTFTVRLPLLQGSAVVNSKDVAA